jgi:hypothetical protein
MSGLLLGGVMVLNVGCYTYQPLGTARPEPGQRVTFELNDQGRVSLGEQLGPGVLDVEGTLQEVQGDQYVLGVSRVTTISGGTANWGGERVRIPVSAVAQSGLRTLSRGRTALAIGVVVVGLGVFIATRGLTGGGYVSPPDSSTTLPAGK